MENRFIGIELRSLNNAVRRYLDNSAPVSGDKITCSNAWIIGYIDRAQGDVYQRDLENEFGITRSTASKVLILLEKKGLICREGVSHDARLKKLTLTDKAKEVAALMRENGEQMESRLTRGFTEQELDVFVSCLRRMQQNLNTDKDGGIPEQQQRRDELC